MGALSFQRPPDTLKRNLSSGVMSGRSTCRAGLRISAAVKARTVRFILTIVGDGGGGTRIGHRGEWHGENLRVVGH